MSIRLSAIYVYPVKAVRGVSLGEAWAAPAGLAHDRRWVIVAPDGRFLSQRTHPSLSRVSARMVPGGLELSAPGQPTLAVAEPDGRRRQSVVIWRDTVSGARVEAAADDWFTGYLGEPCRLVWMDAACRRTLAASDGAVGTVSFADGYPLLVATESSLADLNARLAAPVPMDRFRPNLVITGSDAFAEDGWTGLTIGEARFTSAGACARCQVTTVDQVTGRPEGPEPLRTLATFRQTSQGVDFGVNLVVRQPGLIRVGDQVRLAD